MQSLSIFALGIAMLTSCATLDAEPAPVTTEVNKALQLVAGSPRTPCPRSSDPCVDMYFVAHEDDDVLFMNPDIMNSINQGNHVVVVHITAGDLSSVADFSSQTDPPSLDQYWIDRERGVLNAYAYMARGASHAFSAYLPPSYVPDSWQLVTDSGSTTAITINGINLTQYDLTNDPSHSISLVFMRLSDYQLQDSWLNQPGSGGQRGGVSLAAGSVISLGCAPPLICPLGSNTPGQMISQAQLLGALQGLITRFGANSVSAQDSTNLYSDMPGGPLDCGAGPTPTAVCGTEDYPDHIYASFFTLAAAFQAQPSLGHTLWLRLYRDYTISQEPANLSASEAQTKTQIVNRQAIFDAGLVAHYDPSFNVTTSAVGGDYDPANPFSWQGRQLDTRTLVGTANLQGRLRVNGNCLGTSGTALTSVSCAGAPSWILTTNNQIQLAGSAQCISVSSTSGASDPASLASCTMQTPESTLFMFGDGQIRTVGGRCLDSTGHGSDCDRLLNGTHAAGKPLAGQDWTLIFDDSLTVSTQFDQTALSSSSAYYQTFRIVNKNVCAREAGGVYCAASNGNTTTPSLLTQTLLSTAYNDATGWGTAAYGDTVAAIWQGSTSSMVACGRGISSLTCGSGLSITDYSDANGWASSESYYNSLRYLDLYGNGLVSVCGHAASGVACSLNLGTSWSSAAVWSSDFSNANGWSALGTGDTLQFADIDGDGRTDVCGRGPFGLRCAVMMKASPFNSFINAHDWSFDEDRSNATAAPDFSNADPGTSWLTSSAYYGSIRLVDLNRDGFADVCGRTAEGISCAFSTGSSFERARLVDPLEFTDAVGWSSAAFGSTISFGDLDGDARIDVCGAGYYGVVCAEGY